MSAKGDRFSATSPLSQDDKTFLLSFQSGADDRVLSDENLSSDQRDICEAQEAGSRGLSRLRRAQKRLQEQWSAQLDVKLYPGTRIRWWNISGSVSPVGTHGRQPPEGWPTQPPAWDHPEIWVRGKTPIVAVSQPYPWLLNKHIEDFNEFAESYGLKFKISNYPSWHYPGHCWFVEWYGREE